MNAPLYDKTTPDQSVGLTAALWQQSLQRYVSENPEYGVRLKDDFTDYVLATGTTGASVSRGYSAVDSAAAGGTYTVATQNGPDGSLSVASDGTTNHFGVEVQRSPAVVTTPLHATTASRRGRVVFEASVDFSTADTAFVGLTEAGANFLSATSTLPSTSDYVGFYTADNGTTVVFHCVNDNDGNTAVAQSYDVSAHVQSTGYNKLGFALNKDGSIEICVNGVWIPKSVHAIPSSTCFPIETLTVRFSATAGGGTTAPAILVRDYDCFVERAL